MNTPDQAIARLASVFGEPKTADPELYVKEFRKALAGVDGTLLEKAVDRWIKRDTPFWPRPGELLAEADLAAADLYRGNKTYFQAKDREPLSEEAKARVDAIFKRAMETLAGAGKVSGEATEVQWERGRKGEFEAMQERSRNQHLHKTGGLTPTSKRMTGERE